MLLFMIKSVDFLLLLVTTCCCFLVVFVALIVVADVIFAVVMWVLRKRYSGDKMLGVVE